MRFQKLRPNSIMAVTALVNRSNELILDPFKDSTE